jgi:hypothetical protein
MPSVVGVSPAVDAPKSANFVTRVVLPDSGGAKISDGLVALDVKTEVVDYIDASAVGLLSTSKLNIRFSIFTRMAPDTVAAKTVRSHQPQLPNILNSYMPRVWEWDTPAPLVRRPRRAGASRYVRSR